MLKPAMTDTPAILANVETFLARQYDTRHVQSVPVVKRRTWLDVVSAWLREWLGDRSNYPFELDRGFDRAGAWVREWLTDLIDLLVRLEE